MKNVIIIGAGQRGRRAATLINCANARITAFGDNNADLHGTELMGIPILSVGAAAHSGADAALVAVAGEERSAQLKAQLIADGFRGEIKLLCDYEREADIRMAVLAHAAERLGRVPGAVAELGVHRGDLAVRLNALFPERRLYLFDTFEGFDARDIGAESEGVRASEGDFSDTSVEFVLSRLPHPDNVAVKKGFFPDTAKGLDGRFALVSLDVDLYAPTLAGLEFFWPRLSPGGMIFLHDFGNSRFPGVARAVAEYERARQSPLPLAPVADMHGTAIIVKG